MILGNDLKQHLKSLGVTVLDQHTNIFLGQVQDREHARKVVRELFPVDNEVVWTAWPRDDEEYPYRGILFDYLLNKQKYRIELEILQDPAIFNQAIGRWQHFWTIGEDTRETVLAGPSTDHQRTLKADLFCNQTTM